MSAKPIGDADFYDMAPNDGPKKARSGLTIRKRSPIRIADGVTLLDAKILYERDHGAVVELVWKVGFDTIFQMREPEGFA